MPVRSVFVSFPGGGRGFGDKREGFVFPVFAWFWVSVPEPIPIWFDVLGSLFYTLGSVFGLVVRPFSGRGRGFGAKREGRAFPVFAWFLSGEVRMAEVVDGLTWTRSKPDLRMYREMFGMSTAEFGRLAAVDGRTVRAWENPREWVPDRTAWMAAESLWRDAERMASGLVPEAGEGPVVLPYGSGASTPACVASRIAAGRLSAAGRPWDASFPRPDGPDCGKARFRLMTDMLHLGGEKGSVLFGVTRQTVFAWRHPRMRDSVPSPAAFDAVGERWSAMVARASELAGMMSAAADRAAADGRRRMAPPLTFYRLRSDWEAWHGPDDGGWRSEDCSVWLAAVLLHDMGLEPSVVYAEADPVAMF